MSFASRPATIPCWWLPTPAQHLIWRENNACIAYIQKNKHSKLQYHIISYSSSMLPRDRDTKSFPRFPLGVPFPHQIWCIFCICVTGESCGLQPAFQSWELDAIGTASGQAWSYFTVSRHLSVKKGCDDVVLQTGPFPCFLFFFSRSKRTWLEQTENSSWTNINLCHSPTYLYSLGNLGI